MRTITYGEGLLWPGSLPVARGLAPVRLRSSREPFKCGVPEKFSAAVFWGLLRSPTGASPLATTAPSSQKSLTDVYSQQASHSG